MTRIDFYVLKQAGAEARRRFACRLAEKAYRLDNTVHIETATPADADAMDKLLWTFRDGSFVPHTQQQASDNPAPVTIGCQNNNLGDIDLLINLSDDVPPSTAAFARIAELVSSDEDCKTLSRHRYAKYRELGHTIDTHKI